MAVVGSVRRVRLKNGLTCGFVYEGLVVHRAASPSSYVCDTGRAMPKPGELVGSWRRQALHLRICGGLALRTGAWAVPGPWDWCRRGWSRAAHRQVRRSPAEEMLAVSHTAPAKVDEFGAGKPETSGACGYDDELAAFLRLFANSVGEFSYPIYTPRS